jgi:hypothetical protein
MTCSTFLGLYHEEYINSKEVLLYTIQNYKSVTKFWWSILFQLILSMDSVWLLHRVKHTLCTMQHFLDRRLQDAGQLEYSTILCGVFILKTSEPNTHTFKEQQVYTAFTQSMATDVHHKLQWRISVLRGFAPRAHLFIHSVNMNKVVLKWIFIPKKEI